MDMFLFVRKYFIVSSGNFVSHLTLNDTIIMVKLYHKSILEGVSVVLCCCFLFLFVCVLFFINIL